MQSKSESDHRPYEEPRGERGGRIVHYRTGRKKMQNPVSPSIIHVSSGMQRRKKSWFAAELSSTGRTTRQPRSCRRSRSCSKRKFEEILGDQLCSCYILSSAKTRQNFLTIYTPLHHKGNISPTQALSGPHKEG